MSSHCRSIGVLSPYATDTKELVEAAAHAGAEK